MVATRHGLGYVGEDSFGVAYLTPGVNAAVEGQHDEIVALLVRHLDGDYGDVGVDDWLANEAALLDGSRLLSVYRLASGTVVWVITDAEDDHGLRHTTTVLLPEEY